MAPPISPEQQNSNVLRQFRINSPDRLPPQTSDDGATFLSVCRRFAARPEVWPLMIQALSGFERTGFRGRLQSIPAREFPRCRSVR